jgi:hypothetical protein
MMPLVQHFTPMADVEVAHLALDPTWIEAPTAADAAAARDLVEQRVAPSRNSLRGNGRSLRHLALDRAHGVHEAQVVGIEPARPRGLGHQLANGGVRQQQAPQLLLYQIGRLAALPRSTVLLARRCWWLSRAACSR